MKWQAGTEITVDGDNFGEKRKAKINSDKLSKLFGILEGLYSDKYGSIIREYTSNAVDANIESGSSEPVIIKFGEDSGGNFCSIKDNGIGISPQRMEDVFMNYGTSTKEDTDELIGKFGLGSKSLLSYRNDFNIITNVDGIKYHYLYYKDADGIPASDLILQEQTSEPNGTEIKFYIKTGYDLGSFKKACVTQLSYFDNVFVEGHDYFKNDYKILEGNHFKVNLHQQPYDETHIVFGRCTYPIDWNQLGISRYDYPIAIKIGIGEVDVPPNRESIKYTKEAIELIKERIKLTIEELHKIYDSQVIYTNNLKDLAKHHDRCIEFSSDEDVFTFRFNEAKSAPYIFKDFPWLVAHGNVGRLDKYFEFDETYLDKGKSYKFKGYHRPSFLKGIIYPSVRNTIIYRKNVDRLELNKNRYISKDSQVAFIKIKKMSSKEFLKNVKLDLEMLGFDGNIKEEVRKLRKFILSYVKQNTLSYKNVVVPKEFLDSLKSQKVRDKTKVTVKDSFGTFRETTIEAISEMREVVILPAFNYDVYKLKPFFFALNEYKDKYQYYRSRKEDNFHIYSVSKPVYEKLSKLDNCLTKEQFLDKYKNMINRAYTAKVVTQFLRSRSKTISEIEDKIPVVMEYKVKLLHLTKVHESLLDLPYSGIVNPEAVELMNRLDLYCNKVSILKYVRNMPNNELDKYLKDIGMKPYRVYVKQLELEFKNQQTINGNQEEESGESSDSSVQEPDAECSLTE